jgi:hypothetical protein
MSLDTIGKLYNEWRSRYLKAWGGLYYVDYNQKGDKEKNAVTCSEGMES